jgi:hypothetical protein
MVEFVPAAQSAAVVSKTISRLVHDSFLCFHCEMRIGELESNIEIAWSILNNVDMHDMVCEVHYPSADLLRTASTLPRLPGGVPELRTRMIVVVIWVRNGS